MRARELLMVALCVVGCEGPPGPPGATGEMGEQGLPGMNGMNGVAGLDAVASTFCQGRVNFVDGRRLILGYSIVVYSSGSVWTSCSVSDAATASSQSYFWGPAQVGAQGHSCIVTRDVDAPDSGYWTFSLDRTGYIAEYTNPTSTDTGYIFEFSGASASQDGCSNATL